MTVGDACRQARLGTDQDAPEEVEEGLAGVALLHLLCICEPRLVGVGVDDVPQLGVLEVALACTRSLGLGVMA